MDRELEAILNMSPEERDKRNKKIDSRLLHTREKYKRGHLSQCHISLAKPLSDGERLDLERFQRCLDIKSKRRSWGWKMESGGNG